MCVCVFRVFHVHLLPFFLLSTWLVQSLICFCATSSSACLLCIFLKLTLLLPISFQIPSHIYSVFSPSLLVFSTFISFHFYVMYLIGPVSHLFLCKILLSWSSWYFSPSGFISSYFLQDSFSRLQHPHHPVFSCFYVQLLPLRDCSSLLFVSVQFFLI